MSVFCFHSSFWVFTWSRTYTRPLFGSPGTGGAGWGPGPCPPRPGPIRATGRCAAPGPDPAPAGPPGGRGACPGRSTPAPTGPAVEHVQPAGGVAANAARGGQHPGQPQEEEQGTQQEWERQERIDINHKLIINIRGEPRNKNSSPYVVTPAGKFLAGLPCTTESARRALFHLGAREQTRTATACGHHPLKMACLPISPRGPGSLGCHGLRAPVNTRFRAWRASGRAAAGAGAGAGRA